MVDPDRRPTAQEIEELIDLVRRDPGSPAFIDLGEAYLALGRPRDAIQVGSLGLETSPDNLEGRVMLARAFASLHQWKEAQGELLRVVKVDRANRQGFALLGEVLLRRSDFERAVPVLQHAQNLDPTSPAILSMLRRARAGQGLDPPNPIPQPIPPRGETDNRADIQRSRSPLPPPSAPPKRSPMVPAAAPAMPTMAMEPAPAYAPPAPAYVPPAAAPPPPMMRGPKQTAPPQMSVEGVKPRIVQTAKPQNAAAASLRQSAAVGENYLNELLTGGLLDVAGVRVPEADYDLRPDRRWGRSTRRAFIFLFVVLVLGIGGSTTWYLWSEKEKNETVARLTDDAMRNIGTGDYPKFVESVGMLNEAAVKDKGNKLTGARFVYAAGLAVLLYGEVQVPAKDDPNKLLVVDITGVDNAYTQISKGEDPLKSTDEGYREMVVGKAALDLARLPAGLAKPEVIKAGYEKLADVNKVLDDVLATNANDKWARWLKGRAALAAGDRRGAAMSFKAAADGDDGVVVARIDQANLAADDGKTEEALGLYKRVLDSPSGKNHMLAVLNESLAKAEAQVDLDKVIDDLAAKLGATEKLPSRLAAYRWLALATVRIAIDDYKGAADALTKAYLNKAMACRDTGNCSQHPITEPRFWARVAWVHYKLGRTKTAALHNDLEATSNARGNGIYLAKNAEKDPTQLLVDAGLLLASGLPEKVIDIAAKLEGARPKILRAYALVDMSKPKEALALTEDILKTAGEANNQPCGRDPTKLKRQFEAKALCELATMMSASDKDRAKASEALSSLASGNENQIPRYLLGFGHLLYKDAQPFVSDTGSNIEYAKKSLKKAVDDVTEEHPNPLLYRTLTSLAEIALIEKDIKVAGDTLDSALDANSGYFPARALQARIVLRNNEPDKALVLLEPILKESAAITPIVQLTLAEALIRRTKSTQKDKDQAENLLTELKGKPGVTDEEIGRVAALIDDKLPEKLGVPAPSGSSSKPPKPPKKRGK